MHVSPGLFEVRPEPVTKQLTSNFSVPFKHGSVPSLNGYVRCPPESLLLDSGCFRAVIKIAQLTYSARN
jgi:hypothetical protein